MLRIFVRYYGTTVRMPFLNAAILVISVFLFISVEKNGRDIRVCLSGMIFLLLPLYDEYDIDT